MVVIQWYMTLVAATILLTGCGMGKESAPIFHTENDEQQETPRPQPQPRPRPDLETIIVSDSSRCSEIQAMWKSYGQKINCKGGG